MEVIERTRHFNRNQVIDCQKWLQFVVIEENYRYLVIRFQEMLDSEENDGIE